MGASRVRSRHGPAACIFYSLSLSDSAPNILKLTLVHDSTNNLTNLDSVNTNAQLCHLRVNISSFNITAVAGYWDTLVMQGASLYKSTPNGVALPYDKVLVSGLVGSPLSGEIDYDLAGFSTTVSPGDLAFYVTATATPSQFADGYLVIDYDTLAFGSSIGSVVNSSYFVLSFNDAITVSDFSPNQLLISINNVTGTSFDQLSYTPDSLFILYLPITDCRQAAGVSIDASTDTMVSDYYDYIYQFTYPYDEVTALYGADNDVICPSPYPAITAISTDCIGAGTFDTLTIDGNTFGATQGNVYFNSIDSPGYYFPVFYRNIILWTDNQIQVYVPSFPITAGSGYMYVENAGGYKDSTLINVGYSLMNYTNVSDSFVNPVFRSNRPWVFQLDTNLWNIPGVIATVQDVMANINCQAGVNFSLDTTGPSSASQPVQDSINLISIQPNTYSKFYNKPNVMAYTERYIQAYPIPTGVLTQYDNYAYQLNEADISFRVAPSNPNYSWNWSDANTPTLSQDDFAAFLAHELGHAAGLDHRWPQEYNNVMYPIVLRGPAQRTYDGDANDVLGMYRMINVGATLGTACGVGYATQVFGTGCTQVTPGCIVYYSTAGIEDVNTTPAFNAYLYPNPYEGTTVIHIDVSGYGDYSIGIYDMLGRQVSSWNISSSKSFDVPLSGFQQSAGIYLIQVSDGHSAVVLKMIKL